MRKTFTLLFALMALCVSSWAQTQIGPIDGFYYEIDGSGNATLIKDPTAEDEWQSYSSSVANGVVVIPATVTHNDTDYPVKSIGEYAFRNCYSMTAVVIEEGVETLDRYAFSACNSLTTVSLPSTITSIGDNIFSYSENFNTLICKATEPPTLDDTPFDNVTAVAHIYVPSTSVNDYKAAEEWLNHGSIIEAIPTSVTWNAENGLDDIRISEYTNTSWGGSNNDDTKSAAIDGVAAVISATADGAYATVYTTDGNTNI
ncbi:MAG: leucine-rich repeat domain-containing protein, partial [Paludibacteraceae bacterium]|nr:leucine-rich repeat domain-containing protein [Paludibacteraceae bacterium]